ncbi:HipA domain-containing protein [Clostridium perfringens]|uniref:HipA domain-containing protein n=1 Tax=Clostridium perfringens TaxID=1502 RepID=UPI0024BD057F|nr:hypothetical protein [Clostridium perfringens]
MKKITAFTDDKVLRTSVISSIDLTSTQNGVLNKWYDINTNTFLKTGEIKYGEYSQDEPIVECICSDLGKAIGIDVVKYELHRCHTRGNDDLVEQDFLVCSCPNIITDLSEESYETVYDYINRLGLRYDDNFYHTLINNGVDRESLDRMIIFDFIINNEDRHLNNFGLIWRNGNPRFARIFDNERSLLRKMNESELQKYYNGGFYNKQIDKCKPFRRHHFAQIKLIDSVYDLNLDINVDFIFAKYEDLLSELKFNCMKKLVKERLAYVRKL